MRTRYSSSSRSLGLVALALLAPGVRGQESTWPPAGPRWETDPGAAFARAQKERKVVLAYVASAE